MNRIIRIFGLVCLASGNFAVKLTACDTVAELRKQEFPENMIKDLVCLIGHSSNYRTHIITGPDHNDTMKYGLFQIDDRYWCSNGPAPGKGCNIRCADLLLDDITIASNCAKKILLKQGLRAWDTWRKYCKVYKHLMVLGC